MSGGFFPEGYDEGDRLAYLFLFAVGSAAAVGLVIVTTLLIMGRVH